jgi:general nucleoside transport system ATP-binding protein
LSAKEPPRGAAQPAQAGAAPVLELIGLTKVFGDTIVCIACEDVSLSVAPGEVVAVVGENGAGKTTVMSMAYGLYRPTRGVVKVRGRALSGGSPREAIAAGIGMVHQHFMLIPPLTIAENVALGAEPRRGLLFERAWAEQAVAELSARLGFGLDPRATVAGCSVATQQRVEILKVLYRGAEVLILDEPTAVLAPAEAEALLSTVRALAAEGKSVLFVSHKLREVLSVANRIYVMRRGRIVAEVAASATDANHLADLMVGGGGHPSETAAPTPAPRGARILRLKGAHARSNRGVPALRGVDLELFAGEITAVAGVDGNGQAELAEVITGLRPLDRGELEIAPEAASREALGHIPEDRQRRGLCLSLTVEENLALGRHRAPALARRGFIDRINAPARRRLAEELVTALDIRPPDPALQAAALSGGNQQKVIVARELLGTSPLPGGPTGGSLPKLVVAVQPTRGLDLGAIANVHAHLREARDQGAAVLLISLDLDEVRSMGDRIVVMAGGRLVADLPPGTDEATLGRHMLAGEEQGHG